MFRPPILTGEGGHGSQKGGGVVNVDKLLDNLSISDLGG